MHFFGFFYDFLRIFEVAAENPNTHLQGDPRKKILKLQKGP
jgi:hypothetical protein